MRMYTELGMSRSRWVAAAALFGVPICAAMLNNPLARGKGLYPWGIIVSYGFMLLGIFMMLAAHRVWRVKAAQWYQCACAALIVTGASLLLGFYSLNPYFIPGLVLALIATTSVIAVPTSRLVCLVILSWAMTIVGVVISGVDAAMRFGGKEVEDAIGNMPVLGFPIIVSTALLLPTCSAILGIAVNIWYRRNYGERRKAQLIIRRQSRKWDIIEGQKRRAVMLQHQAEEAKRNAEEAQHRAEKERLNAEEARFKAEEARIKAEDLLDRALTKPVADTMRRNEEFPPELKEVCVIACDIENFSIACQRMPSQTMVDELQRFFALFDKCCAESKVEPLRSQGDSRLALAGLFPQSGEEKRRPAVDAVLAMVRFRNRLISGELNDIWSVRIGIHIGTVRAGVMNGSRLSFDVWGETVNIAARLEQAGRRDGAEPSNRILVSENVLWGLCGLFEHGPMYEMVVKNTTIPSAAEVFDISPAYRTPKGEPSDEFWRVYRNHQAPPVPPRAGWAVHKQLPASPPNAPPPPPSPSPPTSIPPPASLPIPPPPTSATQRIDASQPQKPS